jgi:2-dehydro-3-deoxygluconokinase
VIYDRADSAVTTTTVDELPTGPVTNAETFYTSGITPALSETLRETTAALLERAREADTTVVFDVNYRSKLWPPAAARETLEALFPDVDVLVTAARDAREVLGHEGDAVAIATGLRRAFDFETVIVTRGDAGALAAVEGSVHEQPAVETDTLDPIGSGDAFVGGYLARRLAGGAVDDALAYGAATAALKRTLSGDLAVVTPGEVERVLEGAGGIDR